MNKPNTAPTFPAPDAEGVIKLVGEYVVNGINISGSGQSTCVTIRNKEDNGLRVRLLLPLGENYTKARNADGTDALGRDGKPTFSGFELPMDEGKKFVLRRGASWINPKVRAIKVGDDDGHLVDAEAYVSDETDLATLTANFVGADKFTPAPSGSLQSAKAMFALVTA